MGSDGKGVFLLMKLEGFSVSPNSVPPKFCFSEFQCKFTEINLSVSAHLSNVEADGLSGRKVPRWCLQ